MSEPEANSAGEATDGASGIVVHVFGRTDVGLVREHNEDNFLVADLTSGNRSITEEVRTHRVGALGTVFAVCDGMGGAAAGEVASQIGVDTIYEVLQGGKPGADDIELARRLNEAICEAGTRIFTAAKLNRGQRGMGTTVTAAVLNGPRLLIGQVGDSRAHLIRRGVMTQVTKDQSLVQQLIDAKQLTVEEAREFDRSNIILQALGTSEDVHVDMTSVELRRGDLLVMCSDGLSGRVDADVICQVVMENEDLMASCRALTELACENGGDDNITVIVVRFDGEALAEPGDEDDVAYRRFEFRQLSETTVKASLARFYPDGVPEDRPTTQERPKPVPEAPPETSAPMKWETTAAAKEPEKAPEREAKPAATGAPAEGRRRGRPKIWIGAAAALLACVVIGYAVTRGGDTSAKAEPPPAADGQADGSIASSRPAEPATAAPVVAPAPAPKPAVGEPRLAPTPEKSLTEEKKSGAAEAAVRPAPEKGSERAVQPSKPKEPTAPVQPKEPKAPTRKKAESVIDDNPY